MKFRRLPRKALFGGTLFFLSFVLSFSLNVSFASTKLASQKINILTYSSLLGEGSLGEWIQKDPNSPCAKLECNFIKPHPNRSLFEELRFQKQNPKAPVDLVIGIDSTQLSWAQEASLLSSTKILLGESPLVLLVHQKFPALSKEAKGAAKESVGALVRKLKKQIIIQDPRFSALSQTFLSWGLQNKIFSLEEFKNSTARVFPKWSASYEYFLKSPDLALLTFATSQSYHDCHPGSPATRILEVDGDFPKYQEWISPIAASENQAAIRDLLKFFQTPKFEKAVSELDWLIPKNGLATTSDCFKKHIPEPATEAKAPNFKTYQQWMDSWAL